MKILASTSLLLLLVGATFGQGVVNFNNNVLTAPPDRFIYSIDGTTKLVGTNFVAQLLYQDNSGTWVAHTGTAFFRVPTTSSPGTWSGGNRTLSNAGGVGVTVNLQVIAWDAGQGRTRTFAEAQSGQGIWGQSLIFSYTQALSSPPATSDTAMLNFSAVTCVPEPSCLLLLGMLLPFLLRRRRRV